MGTLALIGLGSNMGDRRAILDAAVAALAETLGLNLCAVSSYHETVPVGGPPGQGSFLNAAASLDSTLSATELHARLMEIELIAGRVRTIRWGERVLDLDLLLFGEMILASPELTVPHPRMLVRRFVMAPVAEIAPEVLEPRTRRTLADLLTNLDRRPGHVVVVGPLGGKRIEIFRRLAESLQAIGICFGHQPREFLALQDRPDLAEVLHVHLDSANRDLGSSRWREEVWGPRWMLTDGWVDFLWVVAKARLRPDELARFREAFLQTRLVTTAPTFVAVWDPPNEILPGSCVYSHQVNTTRQVVRRIESWKLLRTTYRDHVSSPECCDPVLWPDPSGPEAFVEEVLAACSASRNGVAFA